MIPFKHGTTNMPIVDLESYIQQQITLHPSTRIYVGIDSKTNATTCTYALVIAFRYGNNGVHYIYNKRHDIVPVNKWHRLMNEIEHVMNFVSWFKYSLPFTIYAVDMDVNEDKQHFSNRLHAIAIGWGASLGVNVITKPYEVVASRAADYLINH